MSRTLFYNINLIATANAASVLLFEGESMRKAKLVAHGQQFILDGSTHRNSSILTFLPNNPLFFSGGIDAIVARRPL